MTGIYSRKPNANGDNSKNNIDHSKPVFNAEIQYDQRIRGMQGWHCCKYIGPFAINGFKNGSVEVSIKSG